MIYCLASLLTDAGLHGHDTELQGGLLLVFDKVLKWCMNKQTKNPSLLKTTLFCPSSYIEKQLHRSLS